MHKVYRNIQFWRSTWQNVRKVGSNSLLPPGRLSSVWATHFNSVGRVSVRQVLP